VKMARPIGSGRKVPEQEEASIRREYRKGKTTRRAMACALGVSKATIDRILRPENRRRDLEKRLAKRTELLHK